MTRKRFDRQLYEANDKLAKENVLKLFNKMRKKYDVVDNPKKRGVDLFVERHGEHTFNIECEIKRVWKDQKFPYDSIQFPQRKKKFAELDKPTLFVMFNNDQSAFVAVTSNDLLSSPLAEVPNKYVYKGEMFFQVPLEKAVFNNLKRAIDKLEENNAKT